MKSLHVLKRIASQFSSDGCTTLAAALAYYTVFALPPLLYLLLTIVTLGLSVSYGRDAAEEQAQQVLQRQAAQMLGNQAASEEIATILQNNQQSGGTWWKALISIAAIVFSATGLVAAIQASLNQVWEVMPDPELSGLKVMLKKRLLSFALILGLGVLLIVSLIVSAVLAALGERVADTIGMSELVAHLVNYLVQALIATVIFAAMFKLIPDAEIAWRDVAIGAAITTVLYLIGRVALQFYFSQAEPAAQLGSAAASLAIILIWVYYMGIIFLLGAETTQVYATQFGSGIQPEDKAVRVVKEIKRSDRQPH